jgi:hypothetical protein
MGDTTYFRIYSIGEGFIPPDLRRIEMEIDSQMGLRYYLDEDRINP